MYRSPSLRQIEVFKAVIEAGTVSAAANLLNLSQPAVSKMLGNLELDIDIELFERVRGRLVPTERGLRLYQEVERIFGGLRQVDQAILDIRREEEGQINLGVIPGLSGRFLTGIVMRFAESHPKVLVKIHTRNSHQILEWLRAGQLDIGLVQAWRETPGVRLREVMKSTLMCIVPKGHALDGAKSVTLQQMAKFPLVVFQPDSSSRRQMDALFAAEDLPMDIRFEATTAHDVIGLIAAGAGIGFAHPAFAAIAEGRVSVLRVTPSRPFSFHLCTQESGRRKKLVEAFAHEISTVSAETMLIRSQEDR